MSNYTILQLFREEVATHITTLKQCLPILKTIPEKTPFPEAEIEQMIVAVNSLWGITRIVEMENAVNLVNLMKDSLISVQKQNICLKAEEVDSLIHASDLLFSMSEATQSNLDEWMKEYAWDWHITEQSLEKIPNREDKKLEEGIVNNSLPTAIETQRETETQEVNQVSSVPLIIDDPGMLDLFRLEAESQVIILNNGLLAIENNPQSMQELEVLMRAAHSIKGAARIVGLDEVVKLAHSMEDCFVAAQNKTILLNTDDVDILLQAVDLLHIISELNDAELPMWLKQNQDNFTNIDHEIVAILKQATGRKKVKDHSQRAAYYSNNDISNNTPNNKFITSNQNISSEIIAKNSPNTTSNNSQVLVTVSESSVVSHRSETISRNQGRVVRVNADNLNRIMGLAGESLIESNWLQPFADAMMSLKSRMFDVYRNLEQLQESLDGNLYESEGKEYLALARQQKQECLDYMGDRLNELELYVRRTASLSDRLYREVINSHIRPFEDGLHTFPRMIRDLARKLNKQVKLEIIGKSTPVDRDIMEKLEAPLTHILRNAVDHGIELPEERINLGKPAEGTIRLEAWHRGGMLSITISDDGRGINKELLRQKIIMKNLTNAEMALQLSEVELMEFLFLPGFSTASEVTEISGRGVGLDIAKSMAEDVGGNVRASSQLGKGTTFHFQLPLTLSVVRTLLVEISSKPYAIPLARIDQIVTLQRSEITDVENRQYFTMNNKNIGLIPAYQVLELPPVKQQNGAVFVVVISDHNSSYGLVVDKFLGEKDLVVRPLDPRLGKVPDISATAVLGDGSPILVIDVLDMVQSMDNILKDGKLSKVMMQAELDNMNQRKKILVVDDSITVREMERKLLENRGYLVDTAVNGVEGWNAVRTNEYDLVISDIDMPRMNGIELVKQIKNNPRLSSLPVIIISYRDREEDKIQGLEAGADYYLTKSSFHDDTLINAVIDLIGV